MTKSTKVGLVESTAGAFWENLNKSEKIALVASTDGEKFTSPEKTQARRVKKISASSSTKIVHWQGANISPHLCTRGQSMSLA
jgi:hypothetical protein